MGSDEAGEAVLAMFGLSGIPQVSDPERRLYRAFGLRRGRLRQMIGPSVWRRGWRAWRRHGIGRPVAGVRQMPGLFLIENGRILTAFRHQTTADRVGYARLACGEICRLS
jgi:hypothetical protein